MPALIGKIYLIFIVVSIAFITIGCSSGEPVEDIAPVAAIESPAAEADTAGGPETTETELLTEITEAASPVLPTSPVEEPTVPPNNRSAQPIEGSETALAAAKADLSEKTGIPVDQITLISMAAMQWSDASLGCPQEGFMYAQVITPGFSMILEAAGQSYEYHTDQVQSVILCEE